MAYTTIDKPTDYFNTKLYTGNGSTNAITGIGFQPDWVWIKDRGANSHRLTDSVRGATKVLYSDLTNAEVTDADTIQSFDTDGFTLAGDADTNGSGQNFASWNWLAGGSASSNTDGSITSSVSANTTAGFSICTFTTSSGSSDTVGHGLGTTPSWIIVRPYEQTNSWFVWHQSLSGNDKYMRLNNTDAVATSGLWNSTAPTSSVFSLGLSSYGTSLTSIAYCFAEKKGFSRFGSYQGSGNSDGPMIWCGFKPAFLIIKNTGAAKNWYLFDNKRETFNAQDSVLYPNLSNAETSVSDYNSLDFLSNGFKLRGGSIGVGDDTNGSYTYIYMAFAENPFVTSTGIPTTAR